MPDRPAYAAFSMRPASSVLQWLPKSPGAVLQGTASGFKGAAAVLSGAASRRVLDPRVMVYAENEDTL